MLIAACVWYKQSAERLRRLCLSMKGEVDAAVFLDGPYRGLSDEEESDRALYHAIADACDEAGIQWAIFPGEIYDSEPDKRTAAAQAAFHHAWKPLATRQHECLGQERWLMVIDSDEFLEGPIDWSLIEKQGTGTIELRNWRDEDGEFKVVDDTPGQGAKMVRILPLMPGLVWGPTHYDVMDAYSGITFIGHEKGLTNTADPCAVFGHDVGPKTIAAEYEAYNDSGRSQAEGKSLRITEVANDGSFLVVRMDEDQQKAEWRLGFLAHFAESMMPMGHGAMHGIVTSITPTEGQPGIVDLLFERRSEEEVQAIIEERKSAEKILQERDAKLMARRKAKKKMKAERFLRRMEAQQRRGR